MRLWLLALLVTAGAAYYQRVTGPTEPIRGSVDIAGDRIAYKLARSHAGAGDQLVVVRIPDAAVGATLSWRRYPTNDPIAEVPMSREGERLLARIPHQPPAGKVEYRILLRRGEQTAAVPPTAPVITRFKGSVPAKILIPHILLMFLGMLVSNRAGIEALRRRASLPGLAWGATALLLAGGMIFGPLVQKRAFGAYWTGVPFGWDLTDNKTLIAVVVWILAALLAGRRGIGRVAALIAAVVTLAVFLIPHSLLGSQLKY